MPASSALNRTWSVRAELPEIGPAAGVHRGLASKTRIREAQGPLIKP